jgi:hypothetical protein
VLRLVGQASWPVNLKIGNFRGAGNLVGNLAGNPGHPHNWTSEANSVETGGWWRKILESVTVAGACQAKGANSAFQPKNGG